MNHRFVRRRFIGVLALALVLIAGSSTSANAPLTALRAAPTITAPLTALRAAPTITALV